MTEPTPSSPARPRAVTVAFWCWVVAAVLLMVGGMLTATAEVPPAYRNLVVGFGAITAVAGKFAFEPEAMEVKVNEAVVWKNTDTTKHTVTADPDQIVSFKSPTMATDAEFVQTFAEPGTYTYFCSIHGREKMSGTITVTP